MVRQRKFVIRRSRAGDKRRSVRIQDVCDSAGADWHSGQLITQADVESEFARGVPLVHDEEVVPPLQTCRAQLHGRRGIADKEAAHEVRRGIAGHCAVEAETPSRVVGAQVRGIHTRDVGAGNDVVRAMVPTQRIGAGPHLVGLERVARAAAGPRVVADRDGDRPDCRPDSRSREWSAR